MNKKNLFAPPRKRFIRCLLFSIIFAAFFNALPVVCQQNSLCSASAHYTVSANDIVGISTWFPSVSSTTGKVIEIQSGGVLVIDKSFLFSGCKFRCGEGASIRTTTSSITFNAASCEFATCGDYMWQGIVVKPSVRISFQSCWIKDAVNAVHFQPGYFLATNSLRNNVFENNYRSLYLGEAFSSAGAVLSFTYCYNNIFYQTLPDLKGGAYANAHSGVFLERNSMITFGTNGGLKNSFSEMGYGIYLRQKAHAIVANSSFVAMKNAFSSEPYDGSGIYASGSTLTVSAVGNLGCDFQGNYYSGIFSNNFSGPATIKDAYFLAGADQQFGIRSVFNNTATTLDFSYNEFVLEQGVPVSAIYVDRPAGFQQDGSKSVISHNTVAVSEEQIEDDQPLSALFDIRGNAGASDPLEVIVNSIVNQSTDGKMQGIFIQGAGDDCQVIGNSINFSGNTFVLGSFLFDNFGIAAENMPGEGTLIADNTVNSVLMQEGNEDPEHLTMSFIKCGIHVLNCNEPTICSNTLDDTHRAFHLAQMLPMCIFGENRMKRHVHSLHCSNGLGITGSNITNIGEQRQRGNVWAAGATSDIFPIGVAALYADLPATVTTVPFKFYVDATPPPNPPTGGTYLPPSGIPAVPNWFFQENDTIHRCSQGDRGNTPRFDKGEKAIAAGTYSYGYAAEAWDQKRQLWYKLTRHSDWAASNDTIDNFYTATFGSSPQRFAAAQWQFEQAFAPGNPVRLDSLHRNYRETVDDLLGINGKIGSDTTSTDSLDIAALNKIVLDWAGIAAQLKLATEEYAVLRDTRLEALQDTLAQLPNEEPWERAWIAILEVAAHRGLAGEDAEMSATDRASLQEIAEACPQEVGLARQVAITYMVPEDGHLYMGREDIEDCTTYGESRQVRDMQRKDILISPNPASQVLGVRFPENNGLRWQVLSPAGRMLLEGNVSEGQENLSIPVSRFPSGPYLLRIVYMDGAQRSYRFSVVK